MQVEINKISEKKDEKAIIHIVTVTEEIQNAIDILKNDCLGIPVTNDSETLVCKLDKIYYVESVDKHTYVYTKGNCYKTKYRLYELEDMLSVDFFRCSKSMILNIRKIKSVKADFNGRMIAELLNNERIIISRSYVKDLKRKLGL